VVAARSRCRNSCLDPHIWSASPGISATSSLPTQIMAKGLRHRRRSHSSEAMVKGLAARISSENSRRRSSRGGASPGGGHAHADDAQSRWPRSLPRTITRTSATTRIAITSIITPIPMLMTTNRTGGISRRGRTAAALIPDEAAALYTLDDLGCRRHFAVGVSPIHSGSSVGVASRRYRRTARRCQTGWRRCWWSRVCDGVFLAHTPARRQASADDAMLRRCA